MKEEEWLYEIKPKGSLIQLNFKEIWQYRDLLVLFVKRDIVTVYKQTILGPLWYLIQPLFTSVIFTLVFNGFGDIQTGSINPFLFNLAGITMWNYFRDCLTGTSNTFTANAGIFGKVYFPRVVVPMSVTFSNVFKFGIQLFIFIVFYFYFAYNGGAGTPNIYFLLLPAYILIMALTGLGLGMMISSATTKYRDLSVLVGFGVQLLMYVSAVPYSLSEIKNSDKGWVNQVLPFIEWNPLTQIIEGFRFMTLGLGEFSWPMFFYTFIISVVFFLVGLMVFNRTERSFIDTV
ncbi:ABC transporter permease [Nonlabens marinus]|uniref:Transport permease protein n=1 Tax=Nonlabens marinus S1-08 TaxID=1454201 RepID=W8VVT6_9FLAO|nr:ABC transporter permease [Nonlabens marinus]BAO55728.1 O-antigen export system, permease protein [Nonlabens marinus S1-08]